MPEAFYSGTAPPCVDKVATSSKAYGADSGVHFVQPVGGKIPAQKYLICGSVSVYIVVRRYLFPLGFLEHCVSKIVRSSGGLPFRESRVKCHSWV